jgi:hypothetical protein
MYLQVNVMECSIVLLWQGVHGFVSENVKGLFNKMWCVNKHNCVKAFEFCTWILNLCVNLWVFYLNIKSLCQSAIDFWEVNNDILKPSLIQLFKGYPKLLMKSVIIVSPWNSYSNITRMYSPTYPSLRNRVKYDQTGNLLYKGCSLSQCGITV